LLCGYQRRAVGLTVRILVDSAGCILLLVIISYD